jgi:phospholipid N-methyltransferase
MPPPSVQSRPLSAQLALFAKNFFRHPRMLGSIIPSSRFLTSRLLGQIDWDNADVIVEYGPGVGTFTVEILRRMHPDASLIVIETNPEFVDFLNTSIPDHRLHVVQGSAEDIDGILAEREFERADYIISGIPFSTLPEAVRENILRKTHDALQPDGAFLVYQFSPKVLADLRRVFAQVNRSFEPLNVLPAQLFYCMP